MGLDIQIAVDNHEEVYDIDFILNDDEYRNKMSLSREFCNLMCRRDVVNHASELDQIGAITNINVEGLFDMNKYIDPDTELEILEMEDQQESINRIKKQAEDSRNQIHNNCKTVYNTIDALISKLESIPNINLIPTEFNTLNNEVYFSRFNEDLGDGYIGNNFGQDLRNFRNFLKYAVSRGTHTVWFQYG